MHLQCGLRRGDVFGAALGLHACQLCCLNRQRSVGGRDVLLTRTGLHTRELRLSLDQSRLRLLDLGLSGARIERCQHVACFDGRSEAHRQVLDLTRHLG